MCVGSRVVVSRARARAHAHTRRTRTRGVLQRLVSSYSRTSPPGTTRPPRTAPRRRRRSRISGSFTTVTPASSPGRLIPFKPFRVSLNNSRFQLVLYALPLAAAALSRLGDGGGGGGGPALLYTVWCRR